MKNAIAMTALSLLLGLSSCGLLPMTEREFEIALAGPPAMVYDDFEAANGRLSGKYAWKLVKNDDSWNSTSTSLDPIVTSAWSYSGGKSLFFNSESAPNDVFLTAKLPVGTRVRYIAHPTDNSYYNRADQLNILAKVDDDLSLTPSDLSYSEIENGIYEVTFTVGGCEKGLEFKGYSLYIDDLSINPPSLSGVAPAADAALPRAPVSISWPAVPGASSYRLQVSSSRNFAALLADIPSLAATSYVFEPSREANGFYWRLGVDGLNSYGTIWLPPSRAYFYTDWKDESFEGVGLPPPEWIAASNSASISSGYSGSGSSCLLFNPASSGTAVRLRRLATFANAGFLNFQYRFNSSSSLMVYIDGSQASTISGGYYSWSEAMVAVPSGSHSIEFATTNASPVYLDSFSFFQNDSLLASQDFEGSNELPACFSLVKGSAAISTSAPYAGASCLRLAADSSYNGSIVALSSSTSQRTLSFYLKLDSYADDFNLLIDGVYSSDRYPTAWTEQSFTIPSGVHRLEFRLNAYSTTRYAYLDNLVLQ
jgi:hypothetical protein